MKPPVSSWIMRMRRRCATQCGGASTCPYMIVEVLRMPRPCAVRMICSHVSAGSFPLVSTHRTSSSRISAAVPGVDPRPARFASDSHSANEMPSRAAPFNTSIGLNAWMCISGTRALIARSRSK